VPFKDISLCVRINLELKTPRKPPFCVMVG
jgi:hypothetical protein